MSKCYRPKYKFGQNISDVRFHLSQSHSLVISSKCRLNSTILRLTFCDMKASTTWSSCKSITLYCWVGLTELPSFTRLSFYELLIISTLLTHRNIIEFSNSVLLIHRLHATVTERHSHLLSLTFLTFRLSTVNVKKPCGEGDQDGSLALCCSGRVGFASQREKECSSL